MTKYYFRKHYDDGSQSVIETVNDDFQVVYRLAKQMFRREKHITRLVLVEGLDHVQVEFERTRKEFGR